VVVLGSTGSIGTQALDLVRAHPDRFRVVALTAGGSNPELFERQVAEFAPAFSGLGEEASTRAAALACDVVLNGITGAVGLRPTLAALEAGNTLALANKESLIIGGPLVTERARPGQIVPVDSEHSALAQCLRGGSREEVRRLVLTASGGPFRGRSRAELAEVGVEQALAHPTWAMGPVITVNSATLVNKGLEVIEAHLLFGVLHVQAVHQGPGVVPGYPCRDGARSKGDDAGEYGDGERVGQFQRHLEKARAQDVPRTQDQPGHIEIRQYDIDQHQHDQAQQQQGPAHPWRVRPEGAGEVGDKKPEQRAEQHVARGDTVDQQQPEHQQRGTEQRLRPPAAPACTVLGFTG